MHKLSTEDDYKLELTVPSGMSQCSHKIAQNLSPNTVNP